MGTPDESGIGRCRHPLLSCGHRWRPHSTVPCPEVKIVPRCVPPIPAVAFETMPARSGVHPPTAMELMRHSDIRLTTNICQHLERVDTAGALNLLPVPKAGTEARATGTDATRT